MCGALVFDETSTPTKHGLKGAPMRSAMFLCAALFASPGYALADEAPMPAASTSGGTEAAGESNLPAAQSAVVAPAPIPAPPATVAAVAPPQGPEPAIGWGRGRHAPMYATLMLGAGVLGEDRDNRLTTRDSKALEGVTGILHVGATLTEHSRVGARLQSFVRPTKKLVYDTPPADGSTDKWGAVTFGFVGPEYLYTTNFGLYFGGSVGFAAAASNRDVEDSKHKHDHIERGAAGVGCVLSLGYEWRMSKWFAMNAEIFAGGYSAVDDNDDSMKGGISGFAMGAGF
jgi:hypothetical protein